LMIRVSDDETYEISVLTLNGQRIMNKTMKNGLLLLSTNTLANGIYLLQVGKGQPQRLTIQH